MVGSMDQRFPTFLSTFPVADPGGGGGGAYAPLKYTCLGNLLLLLVRFSLSRPPPL